MQKRILDITNLEEIADNAAKEAKKYGVTMKVGKCVKPPYEAVYKRDFDEAISYVAFTMKPDAGTIEIYDIEEILYQCLIKHIHYLYYSICEFAVLLAVDGNVTNQKVEDMKKELIKTSWKYNRPPYRFNREKDLRFEHDLYSQYGFYTHDSKMANGSWNDRVRYGSFFHNSIDNIVIAIGDKYGKTFKRSMHYFCYPEAVRFNTIINSTMLDANTWKK